MGLSEHKVGATVAVADMARARQFYEGKLGLEPGSMDEADGVVYKCGEGSELLVYSSPEHAGKATATVATWGVPDIDQAVDELTSSGVEFERYDEPLKTDEKGIHDTGDGRVAWFKDPDGNTIAIGQFG